MECKSYLQALLALLHAAQISHHTGHWQATGPTAYTDHLLFERLYAGLTGQIDGLAEKMVGLHGSDVIVPCEIGTASAKWLSMWGAAPDVVARAIAVEQAVQYTIKACYDACKDSGAMTLGLDDFLMGLANDHDTAAFLLRQRAA